MQKTYLVALVDKKHGHLYRYADEQGILEELEEVVDNVPRPTKSASWKGLADDKVARHITVHIHEHWKRVLAVLDRYLREDTTLRVFLGGPAEDTTAFLKLVPPHHRQRVLGVIHPDHHAGLAVLKAQIIEAIVGVQRTLIATLLEELENERHPTGRALIGQEPVCEGLNLRQVAWLLIDRQRTYPGYACSSGHSLSVNQPVCSVCQQTMAPVLDLSAQIEAFAHQSHAELRTLPDGMRLPPEAQGLAGLKHYGD
ncbi:hypothetical protein HY523_00350 [Candidatus Berkelbacteria bacterium]|nr:hypothetical protein [Candidatus Berkelbacteria bacterium]